MAPRRTVALAVCAIVAAVAGVAMVATALLPRLLDDQVDPDAPPGERRIRGRGWGRGVGIAPDRRPKSPSARRAAPQAPPSTPTSGQPSVIALLIGVDEAPAHTGLSDLTGAVGDMRRLEDALVSGLAVPEANIELLLNRDATREAIYRVLDAVASVAQWDDAVAVAFAGHGGVRQEGGRRVSFLYTHGDTTDVGDLLTRLARVPVQKRLLLIDACRSGQPASTQFRVDPDDLDRGGSLAWFAACGGDEQSFEVSGRGLFMDAAAQALRHADQLDRDRDGFLDLGELAGHLRAAVATSARAFGVQQTPMNYIRNWVGDQTLFRARPRWSVELAGPPAMRTHVRGRYDPEAVRQGDEVWCVVAPRQSAGRYWPMDRPATRFPARKTWECPVHLGNEIDGPGELFRILLVHADPTLVAEFERYFRGPRQANNDGMVAPSIWNLPIVAEVEVRRTR